jgi:hypothetical protein
MQDYFYPPGTTNGTAGTIYYVSIDRFGIPTNIPSTCYYRTNIHLVTISVAWTNVANNQNISHVRQMQTMLAQHGLQTYLYGNGP